MSNIVSKLSSATMNIDLSEAREKAGAKYQIIGRASKAEEGTGANGPWKKLRGEFEGVNLQTGEVFTSSACFLPHAVNDLIAAQLTDETSVVEFAYEIGTKPSKTSIGYEYTVKALLAATPSESLTHLRQLTAIGDGSVEKPKAVESGAGKK